MGGGGGRRGCMVCISERDWVPERSGLLLGLPRFGWFCTVDLEEASVVWIGAGIRSPGFSPQSIQTARKEGPFLRGAGLAFPPRPCGQGCVDGQWGAGRLKV